MTNMKKSYTSIIIILVIALIGIAQSLFIVDETNTAIVTRFGEPIKTIQSPGLNFKVPFIDQVRKFEKRLLIFDAPPDSLLTSDKKRLVIDVYARGKIVDPLLFFKTTRNETLAASRAIDIISSELRREIASDLQAEIIKTSREQVMMNVKIEADPTSDTLATIGNGVATNATVPPNITDAFAWRGRIEAPWIRNLNLNCYFVLS